MKRRRDVRYVTGWTANTVRIYSTKAIHLEVSDYTGLYLFDKNKLVLSKCEDQVFFVFFFFRILRNVAMAPCEMH